jgi:GT2 family glycosyltransferase
MTKSPNVAVVILNWNGRNFLESFLPSVIASTYPGLEIIVADNASTDQSIEFLQSNYPSVTIIQNDQNYGFAEGYNKVIGLLEFDYFISL